MREPRRSDEKYWGENREFKFETYAIDLEKHITVLEYNSDNLAINFAQWVDNLSPTQRVSVWSKDGHQQGLFNMDKEQLLEEYKRVLLTREEGK